MTTTAGHSFYIGPIGSFYYQVNDTGSWEPLVRWCYNSFANEGLVLVFNPTFNNISIISWRSVLLMEDTGVSGVNHRPVPSHWQTLSHNVVSSTPRHVQSSNSQR
jgi:hypothetical protein